jgi:hypothetical protein
VARGITDPAYGPDKLNEYIKSITQSNPIQWLIGSYYFDWVDVVGTSFVIKQIKDGKLVNIE